ncbi:hypothetical protein FVEG_16256 [Fusarium verticillioides 7600]|uniref:Uncharacterized protein n=1 Tax=Gibberella moniliformis (strain M3125 / FGSC 7600) TaxID=334819 RepID=W7MBC3_GIBM7|nr:hypothetical protein FVEG_16256 [Fusarium verticillioides 7600]EWG48326.1 hypothetical protein FVEG_16256 [Fusarium verticillioides 7600]
MLMRLHGACLPCNRRHQMQDGMLSVGHRICLPVPCFPFPFFLLVVLHWSTLADSGVLVHTRGSSLFKETLASKPYWAIYMPFSMPRSPRHCAAVSSYSATARCSRMGEDVPCLAVGKARAS